VKNRSAADARFHLVVQIPGAVRLFDRASDPRELHDVAADHPDEVARLRALLDASPTR
jgi:hypothetical protein